MIDISGAKINNDRKKVLIVSLLFPPINGMGSVRMGKLTKYLPEFGWEPWVLTGKEPLDAINASNVTIDKSKIIRLPYFELVTKVKQILGSDVTVSRSRGREENTDLTKIVLGALSLMHPIYNLPLIRTLTFEPLGWYSNAVREGINIIDKYKPDAIFSSYIPAVCHRVASRLQRYAKVPWVAEFKDPWALNQYTSKTQPFQLMEENWEKRVLKNSTIIAAISKPVANRLEIFHSKPAMVIPDGFDQDDYQDHVPGTSKFTITHTGYLYPGKRDPEPLFKAVKQLNEEGEISAENFEVRLFGSNPPLIQPLIDKYDLTKLIKLYDTIPYIESVRRQKESTVLLLLTWNDPREWGYPGKIYEYFGAGRPILATAYRGGQIEDLLIKSGSGVVANHQDEIKIILKQWLKEFKQHGRIISNYNPNYMIIADNTWRQQAQKLSSVLEISLTNSKI